LIKTIIDIGSNSIKYLCVNKKDKSYEIIDHGTITNRIGDHILDTRQFTQEKMNKTCQCISEIKTQFSMYKDIEYVAVGTMAFRKALNAIQMLEEVFQKTGISIRILSQEEEACLSYHAALSDFNQIENMLIFNLGGGSTELVYVKDELEKKTISLDFGALILTNKFTDSHEYFSYKACNHYLSEVVSALDDFKPEKIIGIGGTISSAIRLSQKIKSYHFSKIHLNKLTEKELDYLIFVFSEPVTNSEAYQDLVINNTYLPHSHRDIILPGLLIMKQLIKKYKKNEIICNEKGLIFALIND